MLDILLFLLKKIHYLTGKIPVSIDDYFRNFHTLTGKGTCQSQNDWLEVFIADRYFTCQCIRKTIKFLALTGKTPVEVKMNGWSFLLLTGTLPVSVIEK